MTLFLSLLKASWPYVLCAIMAGYLTHRLIDVPAYDRLQASFASYKAQVADNDATAQEAAAKALQAQIQTRLTTEANNGKVIQQLQAERDSAVADAQLARRLLIAAQAVPHSSTGYSVPQAPDRPSATPAGPDDSAGSLTETLAAAIAECRTNQQQLNALIAEIRPQL